jgi:hypothetical protein
MAIANTDLLMMFRKCFGVYNGNRIIYMNRLCGLLSELLSYERKVYM